MLIKVTFYIFARKKKYSNEKIYKPENHIYLKTSPNTKKNPVHHKKSPIWNKKMDKYST